MAQAGERLFNSIRQTIRARCEKTFLEKLNRVLTTSARNTPLRSARFEAEIALFAVLPTPFRPVDPLRCCSWAFSGKNEFAVTRFCAV